MNEPTLSIKVDGERVTIGPFEGCECSIWEFRDLIRWMEGVAEDKVVEVMVH